MSRRITAVIPSFPYSRQAETPYKTKFNTKRYDSWQARPGTLVANLVRWSPARRPLGQVARLALTPACTLLLPTAS